MTSQDKQPPLTREPHKKHAKLALPFVGEYHRNEWAILGAPCGDIRALVSNLLESLQGKWQLAYIDADHKESGENSGTSAAMLKAGARMELTDKISFFRLDLTATPESFRLKNTLNELDGVIVNGNHFKASRQIVVVDPRKDLTKKADRLTNVALVLLADGQTEVPQAVKERMAAETPVLSLAEFSKIAGWFHLQLQGRIAAVKALVLAGGRSTRMSVDKSLIFYHDLPQREHMYNMMLSLGLEAHLSLRSDQKEAVPPGTRVVVDTFLELGPYGALLSAFREDPTSAWLCVACDLPLLNATHLQMLLDRRNPSKLATAFYNPETSFPEPLITLWEPKAYPVMLQFLSLGYSCPRKVLINSDIELVEVSEASFMLNANTPEERQQASILLAGKPS